MKYTLSIAVVCLFSLALAPAPATKPAAPPATKPAPPLPPADPAVNLETLPDFKVEGILKADAKNGSWISLSKDNKGRLLLGAQRGQPITRVTLENGKVVKQEQCKLPVSEVMGFLWANDSLYVDANYRDDKQAKHIFGIFRLRDTKNADEFDSVELIHEWKGGPGEHGAHGLQLGPDKKIYVICGNFCDVGEVAPTSPHRNFADDLAMPRAEDGNNFGKDKKPPGGFVMRMDLDGKNPELFAAGQRNAYDIAFNADGELFGYDSDMEWDWGMPWYRPIRVFHIPSAADQGFREGSAKWPEYYPDSLPAACNIGIGCPTGVAFGYGAKFPAKYQKALYVLDWTYGRLSAVHLTPKGAGYEGTFENLVAPRGLHATSGKTPLNLTDVVIGDDGAMYFTTGGRSTPGWLYRVTYTGSESTAPVDAHDSAGAEARTIRHKLEAFHGRKDPAAIATAAWEHLGSDDRFIRYAARIAIESQPLSQWREKALAEKNAQAALTALLALARYDKEAQPALLKSLAAFPLSSLSESQQLEKLRVIEVSIARHGKPQGAAAKALIDELDPLYPAKSENLNHELCQVLLALNSPSAVARTMQMIADAPTQQEQIFYIYQLRTVKDGWTPELRKQYFSWWTTTNQKPPVSDAVKKWFTDAGRGFGTGNSYNGFVKGFHNAAANTLSADDKTALEPILSAYGKPNSKPKPPTTARALVKNWKMSDLEPELAKVGSARNFERGKEMFTVGQCVQCHKFGDTGGAVGQDLTAVSSRYQRRDVLESILEPSKVISDQYANQMIDLKDNTDVVGRLVEETDDALIIQPNALSPDKITVKKSEIKSRTTSKLSPMPEKLVDSLTKEELLDLLAYLESAGQKDHPNFKK